MPLKKNILKISIMEKKYELTNESITIGSTVLYRIKCLRGTRFTHEGDLGGFVESEANLSHEGDCWIADNAKVFGNARVMDSAWVCRDAIIMDNAKVFGYVIVSDNAIVFNNAMVGDSAQIYGNAIVGGGVFIADNAEVSGDVKIDTRAFIRGDADIRSYDDHCGFDDFVYSHIHAYRTKDDDIEISISYRCRTLIEFEEYVKNEVTQENQILLLNVIQCIKTKFKL